MTRRNPFEELEQLFERMSKQVESGDWSTITGTSMSVDLIDTGDTYELTADLPGFEREDIDITLSGDRLTIEANRDEEREEHTDMQYLRRERRQRAASRSIRLPEPIDDDEASAAYDSGVLTVTLPKIDPGDDGHHIDIQ